MKTRLPMLCTLMLVAQLALVGCGGSSGGGYASNPGGTSGTGITGGSISSFGSVVVNGTRYVTDDAVFSGPYPGFSENELVPGMRVQVDWSTPESGEVRSADTITYRPELVGKVTEVVSPRQIRVIGRTVNITPATLIRGSNSFTVDERLEISGILIDNGSDRSSIDAVRIGRALAHIPDAVIGIVSNSRVGAFDIEDISGISLTVEFSSTSVADASLCVPTSACTQLKPGEVVRVALAANGDVDRIERALDRLLPIGARLPGISGDISGLITVAPDSGNLFRIDGQRVTFNETTEFTMASPAELNVGRRARAVGHLGETALPTSVLAASRIEVEPVVEITLEDAVTGAVSPLNLQGERTVITRVGLEIVIRPNTILGDDSDSSIDGRLDPATLQDGDYVEVHGYFNSTGQLVAVTLERNDDDATVTGCELEARIEGSHLSGSDRYYTITGRPGMVVASNSGELIAPESLAEFDTDDPAQCSLRPFGDDMNGVEISAGFYADEVEEEDEDD